MTPNNVIMNNRTHDDTVALCCDVHNLFCVQFFVVGRLGWGGGGGGGGGGGLRH